MDTQGDQSFSDMVSPTRGLMTCSQTGQIFVFPSHDIGDNVCIFRFEFVRHLFPEAHTVLICNQADFTSVMDYLFYSISVCHDSRY